MNLLEIENALTHVKKDLDVLVKEYQEKKSSLSNKIAELEHNRNIILEDYNLEKIQNAKRFIYTRGAKKYFYGEALQMLSKAIKDISSQTFKIKREYYGCKDYDRFVGQGITCQYGYGPRHGYVVMKIGANNAFQDGKINPDENDLSDILYFLHKLADEKSRKIILRDGE